MDPLSITVGVFSVLQASGAVLEVCYHIRSAMRKVPSSVIRIIEEVRDLRGITEAIQSGLDNYDDPNQEITNQFCRAISDPVTTVVGELAALEKRLLRVPIEELVESRWKTLKHTIAWELEERETKEWIARLERCKASLNLAITSQSCASLQNIERATISFNTSLKETCSRLDENLIKWISLSNPWESHAATLKLHQEGTSKWLASSVEYTDWLAGKCQVFWLSGPPGSGKTLLFAYTVQNLSAQVVDNKNPRPKISAFTYCDFRKEGKINPQTADSLLGSLLAQLCVQMGGIPDRMLGEYNGANPGELAKTVSPKSGIIIKSLLNLASRYQIFLFVDALDELDDVEGFLDAIEALTTSSENVQVFLTSRSDVRVLKTLSASSIQIGLGDRTEEIDRDIGLYIEGRLKSDRKLAWPESGIAKDISQILQSKSLGMFRWAQCQLDSMAHARTIKEVRRALTSLPEGLDEIYNRILLQTPPCDQELLHRALVWLAFSYLPLSLEELWEAVAIEPGSSSIDQESRLRSPEDLLSLGHSLICVASNGQVRLSHASVRDHLLSTSIRQRPDLAKFALDPATAHRQLALTCLTYLCFDEFRKGPCQSDGEFCARIKKHPLARHVAIAWSYHLRAAAQLEPLFTEEDELWAHVQSLALDFFSSDLIRPYFLSWVQIINADAPFKWHSYPRHATPLYYASSFGLATIVEHILLSGSTTINSPGSTFGGTALHAATIRHHIPIIDLLLAAGADPGQGDFHNVTPLHSAASQGNMATINVLLGRTNNNLYSDHDSEVPLRLLAARDALAGKTPAEWAAMSGEDEAARFLEGLMCELLAKKNNLNANVNAGPATVLYVGREETSENYGDRDKVEAVPLPLLPIEENNASGRDEVDDDVHSSFPSPMQRSSSLPGTHIQMQTVHASSSLSSSLPPLSSSTSVRAAAAFPSPRAARPSSSHTGLGDKNTKSYIVKTPSRKEKWSRSPSSEVVILWKPGQRDYFPETYDQQRSGLSSSILVGFESRGVQPRSGPGGGFSSPGSVTVPTMFVRASIWG
ncbi:hypothetical protein V8F06_013508 [Rhypophila decipiens]